MVRWVFLTHQLSGVMANMAAKAQSTEVFLMAQLELNIFKHYLHRISSRLFHGINRVFFHRYQCLK